MASVTENTLKIIDSIVPTESSKRKTNINRKSARKDEDLTHYEQMVIMKKNPYLDLKELELKLYNRACKSVRASGGGGDSGEGSADALARTVGICDEGPYVEIINRGLSGFAIPAKLIKSTGLGEGKPKTTAPASSSATEPEPSAFNARAEDVSLGVMISKATEQEDKLMNNLVKDIKKFEKNKLITY